MKSLEDIKCERVVYDRIGKQEKTLLEEREEATQDSKLRNKHKFKVENTHYQQETPPRRQKQSSTLDTRSCTQNTKKQGIIDMNTDKIESMIHMDR